LTWPFTFTLLLDSLSAAVQAMLPELPRELWAKILLMVAKYTGPYSGTDEHEEHHLAGLMLVCHRWEVSTEHLGMNEHFQILKKLL
jgi:hypothetical protein